MRKLLLLLLLPFYLCGQALIVPWANQQFFDNNGNPLSNGRVYTCAAGSSCPGTPLGTFTTSAGTLANSNPIILDGSGRTPSGIWLTPNVPYKLVVTTSTGAVIVGAGGDNLIGSSVTPVGNGNYWTLSGATISNSNGGGGGPVIVGGNFTAGANVIAGQALEVGNGNPTPNYAIFKANPGMSQNLAWTLPQQDAAGALTSDGAGNLVFAPGGGGGGGGGGTPGGPTTSVQYNNAGALAGSANFWWDNTNQVVHISGTFTGLGLAPASLVVSKASVSSDYGFLVNGTSAGYSAISAIGTGVLATSVTALNYIETGASSGAPPATGSEPGFPHAGTMYCDTGSSPCQEKLYNGSAWVNLASGGATSPGGATTNVQFNSAGSFAGSANFWWDNTNQILHVVGNAGGPGIPALEVQTGLVTSDWGFAVPFGLATRYDSIITPAGMKASSFTAANYITTGFSSGPPGSGGGSAPITPGDNLNQGMMFCDTSVSPCVEKYYNGTAWVALSGGGGGGGTPAGADTNLQYNNAGIFGGSANLTWQNSINTLTVHGTGSNQAITVAGGYVQSDNGFKVLPFGTNTRFDAVQAVDAGMTALSFSAAHYIQTGNSSGTPTLTTGDTFAAGAMYWDNGAAQEKVFNGTAWNNLGTLTITNGAQPNAITVTPSGSTVALTLPQQIGTANSVQFLQMTANNTGGLFTFSNSNFAFWVTGNGAVSVSNTSGAFQVGGANVIDNADHHRGNTYTAAYGNWVSSATAPYSFSGYSAGGELVVWCDAGSRGGLSGAGQCAATDASGNVKATMDGVNGFFTNIGYQTPSGAGASKTVVNGSCSMNFTFGLLISSSGC